MTKRLAIRFTGVLILLLALAVGGSYLLPPMKDDTPIFVAAVVIFGVYVGISIFMTKNRGDSKDDAV